MKIKVIRTDLGMPRFQEIEVDARHTDAFLRKHPRGPFVVHEALDPIVPGTFSVTHIPTGFAFANGLGKDDAEAGAKMLLEAMDEARWETQVHYAMELRARIEAQEIKGTRRVFETSVSA